jgi:hypothetical protein
MTGELVPLFEGHEIHPIEHNGEVWVPIKDLGAAWGLDRTTLYQHINRNKDIFAGCAEVGDNLSHGESGGIYVNEPGLYLLMARVSTARVKNPSARETIIAFRKAAPHILRDSRKEIMQAPALSSLDTELNQARRIAELTDTDPRIMWAAALRKCGLPEYADVLRPALIRGEMGWYNPTRLVSLCNDPDLTPERLNWYLKNKGFQYRDGYIWRLTPMGLIHGREYNFEAPSGHVEIRVAWRESVLYASGLKRPIAEDQTALARAA